MKKATTDLFFCDEDSFQSQRHLPVPKFASQRALEELRVAVVAGAVRLAAALAVVEELLAAFAVEAVVQVPPEAEADSHGVDLEPVEDLVEDSVGAVKAVRHGDCSCLVIPSGVNGNRIGIQSTIFIAVGKCSKVFLRMYSRCVAVE